MASGTFEVSISAKYTDSDGTEQTFSSVASKTVSETYIKRHVVSVGTSTEITLLDTDASGEQVNTMGAIWCKVIDGEEGKNRFNLEVATAAGSGGADDKTQYFYVPVGAGFILLDDASYDDNATPAASRVYRIQFKNESTSKTAEIEVFVAEEAAS